MFRCTLVAIGTFTLLASAEARPVGDWPYQNLVREADVVVLAAAERSADSDDPPAKDGWESHCVGVNTTFRVLAPMKGDVPAKLTLFHFRLKPGIPVPNGPCLASFHTAKADADHGGPCYLLFLKKRSDGRYEPVAGQIDSVLSVRRVPGPWNNEPDERK
jgi:hypothetical protein